MTAANASTVSKDSRHVAKKVPFLDVRYWMADKLNMLVLRLYPRRMSLGRDKTKGRWKKEKNHPVLIQLCLGPSTQRRRHRFESS